MVPFEMVVFGGSGDLAMRKLYPALYHLHREKRLHNKGSIIGVARQEMARADFIEKARTACIEADGDSFEQDAWDAFSKRLDYVAFDALSAESYSVLESKLSKQSDNARVFYLSTSPDLYGAICCNLKKCGLTTKQTRVVLEKPVGYDLPSAQKINKEICQYFKEQQIFRIDHYLGKETVQNLKVLRFGNALFEPLWNAKAIKHVQITVAEEVGIDGRASYYENAGAMKDMIQNHLLQLLCIVAMEPPGDKSQDAIRDEKLKVLKSLRPIDPVNVSDFVVSGQYTAGAIKDKSCTGYRQEEGVDPKSDRETFVALKAQIDNWRWSGVPFFLRTGKRMGEKVSEIVIEYRSVPHSIFDPSAGELLNNKLIVRLQPNEGIKLILMAKMPGTGMDLQPVSLNLNFSEAFKGRKPGAYERLLMDVIRGIPSLFMRGDEIEASWGWVDQIMKGWKINSVTPLPYAAGSWGPEDSKSLIERYGFHWQENERL